jgi:iron complex transport system substrate-binding protein
VRPPADRSRLRALAALPIALPLVLLLSACGTAVPASSTGTPTTAETVTIEHAQGETVVPTNPETVVVFDVGYLSTLDDLGVDVAGVPADLHLPSHLEKYTTDAYATVGTLFEPDYEAVNELQPDLVIVAGRSASAYPQLAELYPTIDLTVDQADFYDSFRERTTSLASIFGLEDTVATRLAALDAEVEKTTSAASKSGDTGLIVLTTGGEVSAFGPGSRFGIIHDLLGVAPAVASVEDASHGDVVSFEFLAEANPDILYVIDRDATIGQEGQAAEQVLDNEIVAGMSAWKAGNVIYLDGFDWYLAPSGLSSMENMVSAIADSVA